MVRALVSPGLRPLGTVVVDGGPGAIWFDRVSSVLYVADEVAGKLVAVRGASEGEILAELEASLGGVTQAPDGSVLVARRRGAVIRVEPPFPHRELGGVDRRPWRSGLAVDRRRKVVYSAAHLSGVGWIERLDLQLERVTARMEGFGEPAGLAIAGDRLFVADRARGELSAVDLSVERGARTTFARGLPSPDGIAMGPGGTLLVTCWSAETGVGFLHRVWLTGRVRCLWRTRIRPGGVAWDGAARIFVSLTGRAGVVVLRC